MYKLIFGGQKKEGEKGRNKRNQHGKKGRGEVRNYEKGDIETIEFFRERETEYPLIRKILKEKTHDNHKSKIDKELLKQATDFTKIFEQVQEQVKKSSSHNSSEELNTSNEEIKHSQTPSPISTKKQPMIDDTVKRILRYNPKRSYNEK